MITASLPATSATSIAMTPPGLLVKTAGSIDMPTDMKKRPSRMPRYGWMSASTWRWYSVSATRRPARKAPRAIDRPAVCVATDVPSATSSVTDAKRSWLPSSAMRLYTGLSSTRPAATMATMEITALMAANTSARAMVASELPESEGASSGMSMSSTTTARSCSSSTENAALPCLLWLSPRSLSTCSTTAVDDSASAPPMTMPAWVVRPPTNTHTAAMAALVTTTCDSPRPKTNLRIELRRSMESSRPMLKSRKTTPISPMCSMACTSVTMPSACGPTSRPAIR
mmetsp:Transcript_11596/g.48751  ORF Transcript_11596/g.48751 Transcript_11596/m.48751 type:complete len:284 (-) Transcript_11596:774-1625(-)